MGISYLTGRQIPASTKHTTGGQQLLASLTFTTTASAGIWQPLTVLAPFTTIDYAITTVVFGNEAGNGSYGYTFNIGIGAPGSELSVSMAAISMADSSQYMPGQHVFPIPPIIGAGTPLSFTFMQFGYTATTGTSWISFFAIPAAEIG